MEHPGFFDRAGPFPVKLVAERVGAEIPEAARQTFLIEDVKAIGSAGPQDLSFIEHRRFVGQLGKTAAGACLVSRELADRCEGRMLALVTASPRQAFARALELFYPDAVRPETVRAGADPQWQYVDPSAEIAEDVTIEPGAVIGPEVRIGRDSVVSANAVVGRRVVIGQDCYIGSGASITHALVGDRVILHAGARIGQDGFGFAMGPKGHVKVPQIGRVVIQDDVEIGANSTVDRGALGDTIIGEGTKIDNLVQIAHNVVIGRHCVIAAQTGLSGSTRLDDFVAMGGQAGTVEHIRIGTGAQIAAQCHPAKDVAPGARMGGTPARPARQWAREIVILKRLAQGKPASSGK